MRKRGSRLLTAGDDSRAEPIVTYTRLDPEAAASAGDGRVEPHFTAVRVDGRGRPHGALRDDELNDLPLVDAPPSDGSVDPLAEVNAGEIRVVRRRRGSRIAALAGVLAIVAGAGVLAATYGGLATLADRPDEAAEAVAAQEAVVAAIAAAPPVDSAGRAVRVVSADQIPSLASDTAALAPRAAADPVAGEAALSDQATVSGGAALSAEPPGRVIATPPLPVLRPPTAAYPSEFAAAAPGTTPALPADPLATAAIAPPPLPSGDVDSALANVDRILLEQRAASDLSGSGDGEFYGPPVEQQLAYPAPLGPPVAEQGYPVVQTYPDGEPYGPFYPGQEPYSVGSGYPQQGYPAYPPQQAYPGQPQQLYPGVDLAAGDEQESPWWLPKRRALVIPNAPVPPADIPQNSVGVW